MTVTDVTEKTFVDEVLMADGLVIVDYWADWCSPCKQMSPIIDELAAEYTDVKFVKVDTNANPNLAAEQGVLSLPTLQFFAHRRRISLVIRADLVIHPHRPSLQLSRVPLRCVSWHDSHPSKERSLRTCRGGSGLGSQGGELLFLAASVLVEAFQPRVDSVD